MNKEDAIQRVASGDVSFAIDTFSYKKNEVLNLKDIHFELKKGETLGVVGRTGAGKTTLLKCLIREYDHFNGELKIGNQDIRNMTLHSVRAAISYVPQDHFLFSTSIGENIAFGKTNASYKEIVRAC